MIDWLKKEWSQLASNYCQNDENTVLWSEIFNSYTHKSRHYHNLEHIYNMLSQSEGVTDEIKDLEAFKFAIWYHDIIYKSSKKR